MKQTLKDATRRRGLDARTVTANPSPTHIYIYIYIYVHMHTYTHPIVNIKLNTCGNGNTERDTQSECTYKVHSVISLRGGLHPLYTRTNTDTCAYAHSHIFTHTCTHILTYTHTHRRTNTQIHLCTRARAIPLTHIAARSHLMTLDRHGPERQARRMKGGRALSAVTSPF